MIKEKIKRAKEMSKQLREIHKGLHTSAFDSHMFVMANAIDVAILLEEYVEHFENKKDEFRISLEKYGPLPLGSNLREENSSSDCKKLHPDIKFYDIYDKDENLMYPKMERVSEDDSGLSTGYIGKTNFPCVTIYISGEDMIKYGWHAIVRNIKEI